MDMIGRPHELAALPPGKQPMISIERRMGKPQS